MKSFDNIKILAILLLLIVGFKGSHVSAQDKEIWEFKVLIGVESRTAKEYGDVNALKKIMKTVFDTVNHKFNAPDVFDGKFKFIADSVYVFTADNRMARNRCFKPHPNHLIHVVVNGYDTGGGYYGTPHSAIYHAWGMEQDGGPFATKAVDGIVHEFGHARGAIDIYACKVSKDKNPVNNEGFKGPESIMNYCYGATKWDDHSRAIINKSADSSNSLQLKDLFPKRIRISATHKNGKSIDGAQIKFYPVKWYSYTVIEEPIIEESLNSKGELSFDLEKNNPMIVDKNTPFDAGGSNNMYFNMLVELEYDTKLYYKWMPIFEVQNAKLVKNSDEFTLNFVIPVDEENY